MTKKSAATIRVVLVTVMAMLIAEIALGATGIYIKNQRDEIRLLMLQDENAVNSLGRLARKYDACIAEVGAN